MQADTGLVYSSPNWRETLENFKPRPISDNRSKLAMEPFPDERVLAIFANLAYTVDSGEPNLPVDWYMLTTAWNDSLVDNGYFGRAMWSPSQQQVVIAHRGTDRKEWVTFWVDGKGVYFNDYTGHMSSAVTFADDIKEAIVKKNKQPGSRFVLSFSGHSLGAWLAGVTTLTVKHLQRADSGFRRITSPDEGLHAHTLALDSPGVEDMLIKICRDYDVRYNRSMCTKQLDITAIFATPNLVNCTGYHVGDTFQLNNVTVHDIDKFIKAFDEGSEKRVIQHWPQGLMQRKNHNSKLEMVKNFFVLRPDKIYPEETSKHIMTIPWKGDTCHLGVFSEEEFNLIHNWSLFLSNKLITLTEIDKFQFDQELEKITFPNFHLDTRRNTITCESREHLMKVIGQTKQLLRWYREDILNAVDKQNINITVAPLYLVGQNYLRTLSDILDCEDTLGLETFLKSREQRVLQVVSGDLIFEAARLNNILSRIEKTEETEKYLNECYTFLNYNGLPKEVNIEALNISDSIDNLVILEFPSPTDNTLPNDPHYLQLRNFLKNLQKCGNKKLVIIVSEPIDSQIFEDYNLDTCVETKPMKAFELSDLTPTSREEILARDAIALGEETLSLQILLGDDCTSSDDELVRNEINQFISPILMNLVTDYKYMAELQL